MLCEEGMTYYKSKEFIVRPQNTRYATPAKKNKYKED
jgi:hypothetical protein